MKLPRLAYNFLSYVGAAIVLICGLGIVSLLLVVLMARDTGPYLGIVAYIVLPAVLVVGVVLIPLGMWWHARQLRKSGQGLGPAFPVLDLNRPHHRRALVVFVFGTLGFLLISGVGSYQAYHYTESVPFCGQTCHTVMQPEFTAYQSSPHARVKCVECHIGPGAGWFARSKLSGAYQVYATIRNIYPRPIPTPISNLRPARETCEQCHWPEQFFGGQQRLMNHYLYDEANTHWPINMLVKTGGGDPEDGQTSGIHWHMNTAVKVEYLPRDSRRQDIPWIRVTERKTGRVAIYQDAVRPLSAEVIAASSPRVMDCIDCHSRPSHRYRAPDLAVDMALLTNQMDATLPGLKQATVAAMAAAYPDLQTAKTGIADSLTKFYREKFPLVFATRLDAIGRATLATQNLYAQNIFPEMHTRWSQYPDNIGHMFFPGCMRCHDGNHKTGDGRVLTKNCTTCHTILSQGSGKRAATATTEQGLTFSHPTDIGDVWQDSLCSDCHSGVQP